MSNVKVEIDAKLLYDCLDTLDDEDVKRNILYKAVYEGAKILRNNTKQYFKNAVGEVATNYSKYISAPFEDGVTLKGDKAYCEYRVSIMRDFRMKFFEMGTKDRYTKDGKYRGKMEAKHFFKDARNASQSSIEDAILRSIDNAMKKILK